MLGRNKLVRMKSPVYVPEVLSDIENQYSSSIEELKEKRGWLTSVFSNSLSNEKSKEYLLHGVCRRLGVILKCCENIFEIFPPQRTKLLSHDELNEIQINLHAYMVNIYGVLDNLAWVYVMEHQLLDLANRKKSIGLFLKDTQKHLPKKLSEYLNTGLAKTWFKDYVQHYRDALAHRIPLYVPPFTVLKSDAQKYAQLDRLAWEELLNHNFDRMNELHSERDSLTSVCAVFLHSSYNEASKPLVLHPQIVCDIKTILEFINIYTSSFNDNQKKVKNGQLQSIF